MRMRAVSSTCQRSSTLAPVALADAILAVRTLAAAHGFLLGSGCPIRRAQNHTADDADAKDIQPALAEVEQMRIEKGRHDVVAHHKQAKPRGRRSAAKQGEMGQPHREKDNRAEEADLDRYRQNLIMRVGGDERRNRADGSVTLEQLWNRPRSMADDRRLGDEGERFLP